MKTAIDKNESDLDKMKRESLEWVGRYGKTAPPFISVAINAFSSYQLKQTAKEGDELFKKVYIKSESDLPKKSDWFFTDKGMQHFFSNADKKWSDNVKIDWYLQPIQPKEVQSFCACGTKDNELDVNGECITCGKKLNPKKVQPSEGMRDLMQYVTNLLYRAREDESASIEDFDLWVESQTQLLSEYASQLPKVTEIQDINFVKWYSGMDEQKIRNAFERYKRETEQ